MFHSNSKHKSFQRFFLDPTLLFFDLLIHKRAADYKWRFEAKFQSIQQRWRMLHSKQRATTYCKNWNLCECLRLNISKDSIFSLDMSHVQMTSEDMSYLKIWKEKFLNFLWVKQKSANEVLNKLLLKCPEIQIMSLYKKLSCSIG